MATKLRSRLTIRRLLEAVLWLSVSLGIRRAIFVSPEYLRQDRPLWVLIAGCVAACGALGAAFGTLFGRAVWGANIGIIFAWLLVFALT